MKILRNKTLFLIIFFAIILYLPSLGVYFSGDDFFHLRVSQVNSISEIPSFFSFTKNEHSVNTYRPLGTQVYFLLGQKLFGLNPIGYHIINVVSFAIILYLLYHFILKLTKNKDISLLTTFFYAFSTSNFSRIYYPSNFQELSLVIFFLASLICLLNFWERHRPIDYFIGLIFFLCALCSKETAVVFPFVALLIGILRQISIRTLFASLFPFFFILFSYLPLRLLVFGPIIGDSYVWDFSPRVFNTAFWYSLWTLGVPEMWVDFIGPGLKINPNLLKFYGPETLIITATFGLFLLFAFINFLRKRPFFHDLVFGVSFAFLTLLPVLFLPWHKFSWVLSLPLVGVSFILSLFFYKSSRKILAIAILLYIVINLTSYWLTYRTHWLIQRGQVAKRIFTYFQKNYPNLDKSTVIYFYNNSAIISAEWGSSKQIAPAISDGNAFRVWYNQDIKVLYEDLAQKPPENVPVIKLGSKEFLGY